MATTLKNTEFPSIDGVVGSMVMVSEVQSENAETPILTTPSGIVIKLYELQSLNAESSIIVTLDGIFIDSSALQPTKADFSIVVKAQLFPNLTVFNTLQEEKVAPMVLSKLPSSKTTNDRLSQPQKASSPILVVWAGIVMFSSNTQYSKA